MLQFNEPLHHFCIWQNAQTTQLWTDVYHNTDPGGKWMIDFSGLEPNTWISRSSATWSLPWNTKILDRFKMPVYNAYFKKNYAQITDERAVEIAQMIRKENKKFCVLYSGGLDSALITVALLKNLSTEELKNISFYCNTASIIENPVLYKNYIHDKFKIFDSTEYLTEDIMSQGYIIISSMAGDVLCGSKNWIDLQSNFYYYISELSPESKKNITNYWPRAHDPNVNYSIFKDLIISFYTRWYVTHGNTNRKTLGEEYYAKMQKNIDTSDVPINSLCDYFWWNLFNLKYIHLATKWYVNDNFKTDFNYIDNNMLDWYNTSDYQQWSMTNNNNGEKIDPRINLAQTTLKMCVRKYIYEFDKNEWYLYYKQKLPSNEMQKLRKKKHLIDNKRNPMTYFAISEQKKIVHTTDKGVKDFICHHFGQYKKDW
jgi:hypothetical protein